MGKEAKNWLTKTDASFLQQTCLNLYFVPPPHPHMWCMGNVAPPSTLSSYDTAFDGLKAISSTCTRPVARIESWVGGGWGVVGVQNPPKMKNGPFGPKKVDFLNLTP